LCVGASGARPLCNSHPLLFSFADFSDQSLVGTDPLNDSLLALWGLVHGGFGFKSTLRGLVKTNAPAPQLEGATHTFSYMGADVCVTVVVGVLERCGGGWP
jgi:hypothetical protein